MFLIDPRTVPKLVEFLAGFGVKVGHDVIVDKIGRLFRGDYRIPLVSKYTKHPVTENFKMASFFPLARSVAVTEKKAEGVSAVVLAYTGQQAWAETDLDLLGQGRAGFNRNQDLPGPVPVAVAGTVKLELKKKKEGTPSNPGDQGRQDKQGQFIVFGDSDFASNSYLNLQGNVDLFLSALSWLAEEADLVSIRPRDEKSRPLILTAIQARLVFWLPVVALPLVVLAFGGFVLLRRRRER